MTGGANGSGPCVALIDGGVDPGLLARGRALRGVNFSGDGPRWDVRDRAGHGAAVARAILAACPEARILPVKIFCDVGHLRVESAVERAFDWLRRVARARRVIVLCAAFSGSGPRIHAPRGGPVAAAIRALALGGVPVVCAVARHGGVRARARGLGWPAALRGTVAAAPTPDGGGRGPHPAYRWRAVRLAASAGPCVAVPPCEPGGSSGAAAALAGRLAALRARHRRRPVAALVAPLARSAGVRRSAGRNRAVSTK